jgi:hypothetical protein
MAYAFQDEIAGLPAMGQVDAAPRGPALPGMFAHAVDPVDGGGEFVYLQGVATIVKGSVVTYAQGAASALAATAAHGSPVAVAMAAIGAGQFGWFQVSGLARMAKTNLAATVGHAVGVSATAGQVADAGVAATPLAGGTLDGAVVALAALGTDATVACQLSRPTIA